MLLYTVGNGTNDDNMFKMAAETRMRDIMKNWANNASAYFYGCRTGASSTEYSSFTTNLSALKNFHNIDIYGQSSFSYPSVYTNRRETTLDILQGNFSYPTYMVGGTKGDGINAFFIGTPAPSMRKSYNGRGHLKNYSSFTC